MRLIDADALKEKLLEERDAIPLTCTERYGFGVEFPNHHGQSMRGGIKKALRCMEQTPTIDAVPKGDMEIVLHEVAKRSKPQWISVEDKLPDDALIGKNILICIKNRWNEQRVDVAHWWGNEQRLKNAWFWCDITHWMPLPEPPKDGEG